MTAGLADIHRAISENWDDYDLDIQFSDFWAEGLDAEFIVLNDEEAAPNQPFPYCVYSIGNVSTVTRMSGGEHEKFELRGGPLTFQVPYYMPQQTFPNYPTFPPYIVTC